MSKGHKAGGGIQSRNIVSKPVRTGTPRQHVHPGGVAQIGQHVGNHATHKGRTDYRGEKLYAGAGYPSRLGNEVAANTVCGPGGSRTVMKTGSQTIHGPVAGQPRPQGRDILSDFGPDSKPRS
jgi:hypothetical protein